MRKLALLGIALLTISLAFAQHDTDYSKVQIKVTKVEGTVYMLQGAGGNIAASVGEDGIVIVDDQYAPLAEKIQAALKGVTDKPIRFIINTHYHEDHVGGNEYFQKQAPIIAHDNVRKRLTEGGTAGNLGSMKFEAKPQPKGALPILTFDHDVTIHLNGEDIRALHFPSGHTDSRQHHLLPAIQRRAHGRRLRPLRLSVHRPGRGRQRRRHDSRLRGSHPEAAR